MHQEVEAKAPHYEAEITPRIFVTSVEDLTPHDGLFTFSAKSKEATGARLIYIDATGGAVVEAMILVFRKAARLGIQALHRLRTVMSEPKGKRDTLH